MNPLKYYLLIFIVFISSSVGFSQNKKNNTIDTIGHAKTSYNILSNSYVKSDSISLDTKQELIKHLEQLDFISGSIYFSGANFTNVVTISVTGKGFGPQSFFDRCISGTRISFYKCQIKNSDSTKTILNKTIIFR